MALGLPESFKVVCHENRLALRNARVRMRQANTCQLASLPAFLDSVYWKYVRVPPFPLPHKREKEKRILLYSEMAPRKTMSCFLLLRYIDRDVLWRAHQNYFTSSSAAMSFKLGSRAQAGNPLAGALTSCMPRGLTRAETKKAGVHLHLLDPPSLSLLFQISIFADDQKIKPWEGRGRVPCWIVQRPQSNLY